MAFSEKEDHFIPSQISFESQEGIEIKAVEFPKPYDYFIEGIDAPLSVLEDQIKIEVQIVVDKKGKQKIEGNFRYQACDDRKCFFPKNLAFSIEIEAN